MRYCELHRFRMSVRYLTYDNNQGGDRQQPRLCPFFTWLGSMQPLYFIANPSCASRSSIHSPSAAGSYTTLQKNLAMRAGVLNRPNSSRILIGNRNAPTECTPGVMRAGWLRM